MTQPVGFAVRVRLREDDPPPELVPEPFDDTQARPYDRTLRLALAMRGGVSLAVWIGGTVAELDILRRLRLVRKANGMAAYMLVADPGSATRDHVLDAHVLARAGLYARMLAARGFDRVELDVLAGASAGGLNAVTYAAAQRNGAAPDEMLHTWVAGAGMWRLFQRAGLRPILAPLRGDDYFARAINNALSGYYDPDIAAGSGPHRADRVVVDLSATVLDREDGPDRGTREGRGHFHFVGAAHPDNAEEDPYAAQDAERKEYRRAIPPFGSPEREQSLARLAYAARATSSVPGGFEPALIFSVATSTTSPPDDRIDMSFAFHAHRTATDVPFRIIDGGLTDNIPIDRAYRAIRNMPSSVHSRRALIYLNPKGPLSIRPHVPEPYTGMLPPSDLAVTEIPPRTDRLSLALNVIGGALAISFGRESGDAKAETLDDFRRELILEQGRDQALAVLVADLTLVGTATALRTWVRYRASTDFDLLTRVLLDPAVWQLGTDQQGRAVATALELRQLTALEKDMVVHYDELAAQGGEQQLRDNPVCAGPEALHQASLNLLSWIQSLERARFEQVAHTGIMIDCADYPTVGDVRVAVYGVLDEAEQARDRVLARVVADVNALPDGSNAQRIAGVVRAEWLRQRAVSPGWALLDRIVAVLQRIPAEDALIASSTEWAQSPWRGLSRRSGLRALDTCAFTAARGIREPLLTLDFWSVSAGEHPAHHRAFVALLRAQLREGLRAALTLPATQLQPVVIDSLLSDDVLRPVAKLNGANLASLSGFLSSEWRLNDWWWGRLDAGAGVARFLRALPIDAPLPPDSNGDAEPDPVLFVQDEILLQAEAHQEWAPVTRSAPGRVRTPDEIRAGLARGADSLGNLEPGYRVAVGSRAVRVASRALTRWGSPAWMHVVNWLLRPVGVLAPVVLDLPRALAVAAVLGGALALSSSAAMIPGAFTGAPVFSILLLTVALLGVALAGYRSVHAFAQWATIIDIVVGLDASAGSDRATEVRRQRRLAIFWCVVGMIGGGGYVSAGLLAYPGVIAAPAALVLVLAGCGAFLNVAARVGTLPQSNGYLFRDTALGVTGLLVLLIVPLTSRALGGWIASLTAQPGALLVAVSAALVSLVVNWGWQAGWHAASPRAVLTSVVGFVSWLVQASAAAGAAWLVAAALLGLPGWNESVALSIVGISCALFVSGTVQWWLPDLLAWLPQYEPQDLTRRVTER
ncbi:DUF3376 domain-containing protein [Cryobacterium psychrophilum]|uniref:DUF3376 domain-containing protein n=1 Tax=Cryobacterium psychrophilum TaxID=41988 RepID=A0A4Y8KPS4_9MICO|nr:DUF3376 domain-containing protein [Cryobacterium psychrophilum]TDW30908.1 patatin-related protein [Cryobacterium psychrophilum]TFD80784.1 DUF3376 domain-containing protein [Cryobacterium psychrophilum]